MAVMKWCYYKALKMCLGHPEKGGIKSSEKNTGTFHKHWDVFELDCQTFLWLEVEGMSISQTVAPFWGIASSSQWLDYRMCRRIEKKVKGCEINFLNTQRETANQKRTEKNSLENANENTWRCHFFFYYPICWDLTTMLDERLYWQMCGEIVSIHGWKENKLL